MKKYVKKLKVAESLDGSYVTDEVEYENNPQPYIVCSSSHLDTTVMQLSPLIML